MIINDILFQLTGSLTGALSQGVLWGIMALGVFITFKILDFPDMTVDGSFALGGCVCAVFLINGVNPFVAVVIASVAGSVAGLLTGCLTTKLKIPGILAGILVQLALYSINLRIMGGPNVPLMKIHKTIMNLVNRVLNLNAVFGDAATSVSSLVTGIVFCFLLVQGLYWFFGTELGSAIRATGDNARMSRAQGINTDAMQILALMLSNALVAMSGALVMQQQRFGDVSMGIGAIVIGLASIIIGEVIFGRRFAFWWILLSVIFGSVIYRVIIAIVLQLGMKTQDLKLLSAVIVAIALSVPVIKKNLSKKRRLSNSQPEVK